METAWRVSLNVSALHAAHAIAIGATLVDEKLAAALSTAALHLRDELEAIPIPTQRLWRHLLPLAGDVTEPRELARRTLVKAMGGGSAVQIERLAERLVELEVAFKQAVRQSGPPLPPAPGATHSLLEELRLRERPLREQFEARGPGLLAALAELTEPALVAPSAAVYTVHPVLGGGGAPHLDYNSVRIEAVLANVRPDLPEVVRLAWLLSQLQQDLPAMSETIPRDRLEPLAALAMLPAILAAAERVELARCDAQTLLAAIDAWRIEAPPSWSADRAAPLWAWWQSYQAARPRWRVALAALAAM
jgi:hypothetical protein